MFMLIVFLFIISTKAPSSYSQSFRWHQSKSFGPTTWLFSHRAQTLSCYPVVVLCQCSNLVYYFKLRTPNFTKGNVQLMYIPAERDHMPMAEPGTPGTPGVRNNCSPVVFHFLQHKQLHSKSSSSSVALLWTCSILLRSVLQWRAQNWTQSLRCSLTCAQYRGTVTALVFFYFWNLSPKHVLKY